MSLSLTTRAPAFLDHLQISTLNRLDPASHHGPLFSTSPHPPPLSRLLHPATTGYTVDNRLRPSPGLPRNPANCTFESISPKITSLEGGRLLEEKQRAKPRTQLHGCRTTPLCDGEPDCTVLHLVAGVFHPRLVTASPASKLHAELFTLCLLEPRRPRTYPAIAGSTTV